METRKITIVSTKNQKKSVIMSAATTLAELKADLRQNNIDYSDMTFYEGLSKTELKDDASVLPHDVPYKGVTTNELVFMLTNSNKKIKSGAMSRAELFRAIRVNGLQDKCVNRYGKHYTNCKSSELEELLNKKECTKGGCVDTAAREAITKLVSILESYGAIYGRDSKDIMSILGNEVEVSTSYSDEEIDAMFENIN